jgi:hypothetical protein
MIRWRQLLKNENMALATAQVPLLGLDDGWRPLARQRVAFGARADNLLKIDELLLW